MDNPLKRHRARLAEAGLKRVEVLVPAQDSRVIRRAAQELTAGTDLGDKLRAMLPERRKVSFAEWLAQP